MKIELNKEASTAAIVLTIAVTIIAIAFLVYRYNAVAYENGYTQKTLETTSMPVWVRE